MGHDDIALAAVIFGYARGCGPCLRPYAGGCPSHEPPHHSSNPYKLFTFGTCTSFQRPVYTRRCRDGAEAPQSPAKESGGEGRVRGIGKSRIAPPSSQEG